MDLFTPESGLLFWQSVVLLVVLVVLRIGAWGPLLALIQAEEEKHTQAAQSAREARALVQKLQQEAETIIAKAEASAQKILQRSDATQKRLIAEAQEEIRQQRKQEIEATQQRLAQEREASVQQLHTTIAKLVLHTTATLLQQELSDPRHHQHHLEQLIKKQAQAKTHPTAAA